jgi:hypothetical protein
MRNIHVSQVLMKFPAYVHEIIAITAGKPQVAAIDLFMSFDMSQIIVWTNGGTSR